MEGGVVAAATSHRWVREFAVGSTGVLLLDMFFSFFFLFLVAINVCHIFVFVAI